MEVVTIWTAQYADQTDKLFQHLFFLMEVATSDKMGVNMEFHPLFQHLFFLTEVATIWTLSLIALKSKSASFNTFSS